MCFYCQAFLIYFSEKVILKIPNDLNINKAHGHDHISIGTIKLCSKSVVKSLSIFKNCIDTGTFPDIWKRSHIIAIHNKGDKKIINNYRPVSLLPIFEKIFGEAIYFLILYWTFWKKTIHPIPINKVLGEIALVRSNFSQ